LQPVSGSAGPIFADGTGQGGAFLRRETDFPDNLTPAGTMEEQLEWTNSNKSFFIPDGY